MHDHDVPALVITLRYVKNVFPSCLLVIYIQRVTLAVRGFDARHYKLKFNYHIITRMRYGIVNVIVE